MFKDPGEVPVWVVIVVALSIFLLSWIVYSPTAKGDDTVCETVCWIDGWGRRVCETRCRSNDLGAK
jgi:hypothetical protein